MADQANKIPSKTQIIGTTNKANRKSRSETFSMGILDPPPNILFSQISADRAFAFRLGDWFGCWIAEREQNVLRLVFPFAIQFGGGGTETFQSEIVLAVRALDAVKEGGEFDKLVAGVEKIEVEDLLARHTDFFLEIF